jgi:nucleoside-diphosphate-sugar epimerase
MDSNAQIFVSGHRGLVGSAICRRLSEEGAQNLALCRLSNPRSCLKHIDAFLFGIVTQMGFFIILLV